ncbi:hypothetical protein CC80DRAFT_497381 [Byssothecium circinans]|uniref:Eisosome protein 1 n=1 Tax=Byssothecium circinans TaxID=147558 RepID=A0A6A5TAA0_9PLEO|nr:hypothetical protein CC80DRAFT_497381 [Byssothecium circinans]
MAPSSVAGVRIFWNHIWSANIEAVFHTGPILTQSVLHSIARSHHIASMAMQTQATPNGTHTVAFQNDVGSPVQSSEDMRCPDPSAHHKATKEAALQNQASAAALYSTGNAKANTRNPLGPDGKLSSASAATSLKHAQTYDLPSFPVHGIDTKTSANTAANLANTNTKSPEWWKPELSSAAGKAALLANDYKMEPLWKPEASAAGSKAALLAHKDGANLNLWRPEASAQGFSAANIAMGKKGLAPHAVLGSTEAQKKNSLLAATGAVSSGRRRAQSHPAPPSSYPDAGNSARNALSAATIAHSPSMKMTKSPTTGSTLDSTRLGSPAMQAARIQHSKVSREMYTEHPPVALEVEERNRQDALRASAISMAKKMYDVQQHHIDQAAGRTSHAQTGATMAQSQKPYSSDDDIKQQAMQYIGIQEAAQRLASERLAKMDTDQNAAYRSYYGYEKQGRSRLSIRRGRNRAASNPETVDSDDELQSRRIRSQMSHFNKSLAEVDKKKQEQDRGHLLAAAQRKVQAQMLGIDKKIFDETGKMSPAMLEEWDAKARAKATANSEVRMENHGRVHIGHGKYMDQAEIDAVAQARIQPTLDEITEKTEKRRAEEEEQRLDIEEKKRQAQSEKERAADLKAEEKRGREEEKRIAKQEKEAEKEKRAEEKKMVKQEKRKSREAPRVAPVDAPAAADDTALGDNDDHRRDATIAGQGGPQSTEHDPTSPAPPMSPKSESKVKSLLRKFKRRSKHSGASSEADKPGFIGGAALRSSESNKGSAPGSPAVGPTHMPERRFSDVSSISSVSSGGRDNERTTTRLSDVSTGSAEFEEARDIFNADLAPPPNFTTSDASAVRKGSPSRGESRFREIGI